MSLHGVALAWHCITLFSSGMELHGIAWHRNALHSSGMAWHGSGMALQGPGACIQKLTIMTWSVPKHLLCFLREFCRQIACMHLYTHAHILAYLHGHVCIHELHTQECACMQLRIQYAGMALHCIALQCSAVQWYGTAWLGMALQWHVIAKAL